jgi:hypothetical protein
MSKGTALRGLLIVACSCAPPPQLLVIVDTDAPLVGQLAGRTDLSPDAAVDLLRVDVLDGRRPIEQCEITAPEPAGWPISFGVLTPDAPERRAVRLRLRLFRAVLAVAEAGPPLQRICGRALGQGSMTEPRPEVTIERLVDLPLPGQGVAPIHVLLSFDCLGEPSSFYP